MIPAASKRRDSDLGAWGLVGRKNVEDCMMRSTLCKQKSALAAEFGIHGPNHSMCGRGRQLLAWARDSLTRTLLTFVERTYLTATGGMRSLISHIPSSTSNQAEASGSTNFSVKRVVGA